MRKFGLLVCMLLVFSVLYANCPRKKSKKKYHSQLEEIVVTPQNFITSYKASYQKLFDLQRTKLHLTPNFKQKTLSGKATLTLKPHFYEQNQLVLDAKWMQIAAVALKTNETYKTLKFTYDNLLLKIDLDKYYSKNDQIEIEIDYVALPYQQDSLQVEDGRGLYFIDTEDKNPYKPMHLWSQGESESASCWFPTLDATNQKSTQEIFVTIDTAMVSLSNGLLIDSKPNGDGTKTDHWKQDKPHSPYLFFLGVGDYYISRDKWRDKEVTAYTFPKYKDDVAEIFKNLPAMMEFFSKILGVDYPWDKLGNIMSYDYTAGAMENTSAIIYFDRMLCHRQQLIDGDFDWIIAHELFHHWFGDLVTAESWANLTINESFADYSEYLWYDFRDGKDEGDAVKYKSTQKYFRTYKYKNEPIVNYYYVHPSDVFDGIRYEKGGAVLHMLRYYVGDDAFFKSLNKFLQQYKFNNAELSDLRKCFEETTGEDLNWFFNQWWLDKGHPILDITHQYDEKNKTIALTVRQTQRSIDGPTFRIPTKVDIYSNNTKETKVIDITDRIQTFYFPSDTVPQLVNFDADKVLVCEKTENLSTAQNLFKYYNAPLFVDKLEAINALALVQKANVTIQELLLKALQDKNWTLREEALDAIEIDKFDNKTKLSLALQQVIYTDNNSHVREKAIQKYARLEKNKSIDVLETVLKKDSSFICLSAALAQLNTYDKSKAYTYATKLSSTENSSLLVAIGRIFKDTTADNMEFFKKAIWLNGPYTFYSNFRSFADYLEKANNTDLEKGILFLKDIYTYEESNYNKQGAKQIVGNLYYYFNEKAKKDSQASVKLQIVKKAGKELLN